MDEHNDSARVWWLFRIALIISGLIILFLSGIFPIEDYLTQTSSTSLTASVVPAEVASLTNENRTKGGLPELMVSPLLTQAAQLKANDMAKNSYYAHTSPDGKSPLYWLDQVGYKYINAGENLVIDRTSSEEAVNAWMHSPEHRENILRPQFTEIGVGVASGEYQGIKTIFVVEEFGTPYPLGVRTPTITHSNVPMPTKTVETKKTLTSEITSALTITALPKTQITNDIQTLVTPITHKPITISVPKPIRNVQTVPKVASTSTGAVATTTYIGTHSSTTSSFVFALAPEFFAPVTIAAPLEPRSLDTATPMHSSESSIWVRHINLYIQHILGVGSKL